MFLASLSLPGVVHLGSLAVIPGLSTHLHFGSDGFKFGSLTHTGVGVQRGSSGVRLGLYLQTPHLGSLGARELL